MSSSQPSYPISGVTSLDSSDQQTVSLSVVSAVSTRLAAGSIYAVWASVDCFLTFGNSSVAALTTNYPLTGKLREWFVVLPGEEYLAGLVSSGTGVLYIQRMLVYFP